MSNSPAATQILYEYATALRQNGRMEYDIVADLQDLGLSRAEAHELIARLKQEGVTIECHRVMTLLGWILIPVPCVFTLLLAVAYGYFLPASPSRGFFRLGIIMAVPPAILVYVGLLFLMNKLGLECSKLEYPRLPRKDVVQRRLREVN